MKRMNLIMAITLTVVSLLTVIVSAIGGQRFLEAEVSCLLFATSALYWDAVMREKS